MKNHPETLPASPASVWTNPIHFLAFGFGSGTITVAPGTWGTVAAIPCYLILQHLPLAVYSLAVIIAIMAGIFLCDRTAKDIGVHDYPGIVWDEIAGYLLTMLFAPAHWLWIIIGFALFRVFDIWKPWPIGWLDQKITGGLGIMVDDLVAALYAGLLMLGMQICFKII